MGLYRTELLRDLGEVRLIFITKRIAREKPIYFRDKLDFIITRKSLLVLKYYRHFANRIVILHTPGKVHTCRIRHFQIISCRVWGSAEVHSGARELRQLLHVSRWHQLRLYEWRQRRPRSHGPECQETVRQRRHQLRWVSTRVLGLTGLRSKLYIWVDKKACTETTGQNKKNRTEQFLFLTERRTFPVSWRYTIYSKLPSDFFFWPEYNQFVVSCCSRKIHSRWGLSKRIIGSILHPLTYAMLSCRLRRASQRKWWPYTQVLQDQGAAAEAGAGPW